MPTEIRTTDSRGRSVLPKSFANASVMVEQVSETEVRIRRAKLVAEGKLPFPEEMAAPLSDRDLFLALLENPPSPNDGTESGRPTPQGQPWLTGSSGPWRAITNGPLSNAGSQRGMTSSATVSASTRNVTCKDLCGDLLWSIAGHRFLHPGGRCDCVQRSARRVGPKVTPAPGAGGPAGATGRRSFCARAASWGRAPPRRPAEIFGVVTEPGIARLRGRRN